LIENYDGTIPFHQYLKSTFAKNRKFGSGDRRIYRSWCYAWFRLGKALHNEPFFKRLTIAYFLVNGNTDEFSTAVALHFLNKNFNETFSINQRIAIVQELVPSFFVDDVFPFTDDLSAGIDRKLYAFSMLTQPSVFGRITKGPKLSV
jgi:16S rRNA (cytosine967-C5)-methyltransferase